MDCIDCHNRPTHIYTPPDLSVDRSMVAGSHRSEPALHQAQGVEVLTADYKTQDEAQKAIAEKIQRSSTRRSIRRSLPAKPTA